MEGMACTTSGGIHILDRLIPTSSHRDRILSRRASFSKFQSNFLSTWPKTALTTDHYGRHGKLRNRCACQASLELVDGLRGLVLGVGVGLPCTVMECGDVVYRSTLPQQGLQITTPGVALTVLVVTYLWANPGQC